MKNLLNYIEQENAWRKALSVSVKNITSNPNYLRLDTHEERQKIANEIDSGLSPENLSCDGELPIREINARYKRLTAAAKDLMNLDPAVKMWEYDPSYER